MTTEAKDIMTNLLHTRSLAVSTTANDLEGAYMRGIQAGFAEGYNNGLAFGQNINEEFHKKALDSRFEHGKREGYDEGYDKGCHNGLAYEQHISEEFHKKACDSWYEKGKIDGVSEYLERMKKIRATAPVINNAPAKKRGRPRKVAHESC